LKSDIGFAGYGRSDIGVAGYGCQV